MATLRQVKLTCDLCGNPHDVQTRTIGLDGRTYEIDLCGKDNEDLSRVAADYIAKARKITARQSRRRNAGGPRAQTTLARARARAPGRNGSGQGHAGSTRQEAKTRRSPHAAQARGVKARASSSTEGTKSRRSGPRKKKTISKRPAKAPGAKGTRIFVYGILPADAEIAAEMPGIGEHPGVLRIVRSDGLAALISEFEPSGRLGTPDDLKAHREILDGTAMEVPIVPLRFGTALPSEDAVADELLAAHHDEFADALEELEGRVEFVAKGRYVGQASTPKREEATRALGEAMQRLCVASVARELAHEREAVDVAFLVDASQESEVERVIGNLARDWERRIELQLLGPTAAYDFVKTARLPA